MFGSSGLENHEHAAVCYRHTFGVERLLRVNRISGRDGHRRLAVDAYPTTIRSPAPNRYDRVIGCTAPKREDDIIYETERAFGLENVRRRAVEKNNRSVPIPPKYLPAACCAVTHAPGFVSRIRRDLP